MAEFGDVAKEFHAAKPQTKVLLVVGGLAVVGVIWYLHTQSSGATTPVQMPGQGYSGGSGGAGGIQTVPTGAEGGGVPLLPGGYIPLFDPSGQLIGYQPTQTTTTPAPTPTPTPAPKPGGRGKPVAGGKDRSHRIVGRLTQGQETQRNQAFDARLDKRVAANPAGGKQGVHVPATNPGATRPPGGGRLPPVPIPMNRPQRANPSLQRTTLTRTAARTRTT